MATQRLAQANTLFPFIYANDNSSDINVYIIGMENAYNFSRQRWAETFPAEIDLRQRRTLNPDIVMPYVCIFSLFKKILYVFFQMLVFNLKSSISKFVDFSNYSAIFVSFFNFYLTYRLGH
jgi:hypothetical protein